MTIIDLDVRRRRQLLELDPKHSHATSQVCLEDDEDDGDTLGPVLEAAEEANLRWLRVAFGVEVG